MMRNLGPKWRGMCEVVLTPPSFSPASRLPSSPLRLYLGSLSSLPLPSPAPASLLAFAQAIQGPGRSPSALPSWTASRLTFRSGSLHRPAGLDGAPQACLHLDSLFLAVLLSPAYQSVSSSAVNFRRQGVLSSPTEPPVPSPASGTLGICTGGE